MSRYRNPVQAPAGKINWWLVGPIGLAGLYFWPLLVVALCVAVSQSRGPNHYTKFAVPYAYRFKWDAGWITLVALGVPCALALYGAARTDDLGAVGLIPAIVFFVASLRVIVWLSFRFPLTSWFCAMFLVFLFGIGWRARMFF